MQFTRVRMRATGQVQDMLPNVARALVTAGYAELVDTPELAESQAGVETAAIDLSERAVSPAQEKSKRKPGR